MVLDAGTELILSKLQLGARNGAAMTSIPLTGGRPRCE